MLGLALLAIGAVLLWAAFSGRGQAMLNAMNLDLTNATSPAASGGAASDANTSTSAGHNFASAAANQPGPGGQGGQFQIGPNSYLSGSYASLTEVEKSQVNDWANNHASQINA